MKKRYYNLFAIPALAVIVLCLLSGFSARDPQDTAMSLIDQRANILRSLSKGEIPSSAAEKKLREIEAETLLTDDLKQLRNTDPDADKPCIVQFKEISKKRQFFQYITYEAEIVWDAGDSTSEALYNVVVKNDGSDVKLTIFEPLNV